MKSAPRASFGTVLLVNLGLSCSTPKFCLPNNTQRCFCPGALQGAQTCSEDGRAWDECDCTTSMAETTDSGADEEVSKQKDACVVPGLLICYEFTGYPGTEEWCAGRNELHPSGAQYYTGGCSPPYTVGTCIFLEGGDLPAEARGWFDSTQVLEISAEFPCEILGGVWKVD